MPDLDFDLTEARDDQGRTRLVLRGELDLGTVGRLERALAAAPAGIVLDLRDLTFMDSTGVRVLLEAAERAAADERPLAILLPAGGDARVTIEETGIAGLLPLEEPPR